MMKAMLKPGGVLAVCIDQRELFRLGQMLDELFREQNRIAIINWQRSYTRTNDAANVATTTEYLLVYARDLDKAKTGLLPRKDGNGVATAMPDNDPRPWTDGPATGSNAKAHKSMVYAIQSPFTGALFYPPVGSAWRAGQEQNLEWLKGWGCEYILRDIDDLAKRTALIGVAASDVPSVKAIVLGESLESASNKATVVKEQGPWPMFFFLRNGLGRPRLKKYVEHLKPGYVPTTFWASDDFTLPKELGSVSWPHQVSGHSEQGVDELTAIVGKGHEFKTVKPLKLFQQVVELWSPNDGLVLDPFAGTGTTAHAVLASNANKGAVRRFIMIEQGRPERGDSYARTLTSKRLQRAVSGKWANGKGKPLGGGFEFVTLAKRVDADALLKLERDEMVDTIIGSHFESEDRRGPSLVRISKGASRYLVGKNMNNEGVFLVWNGPGGNINITREVYSTCVQEAKAANLEPVYHIYARLFVYQTNNVVFYQIPDRILADFGLDLKNEPFADTND
jgi:adenine-specific DNA-methyltransferase